MIPKQEQADCRIKVRIQQPSLANYRLEFFRALSKVEDFDVELLYGNRVGISNCKPDGFRANFHPLKMWSFAGQKFFWHTAQLKVVRSQVADVAILTWNTRYLSLLPALLSARRNGVKTLLWGHGYSKNESSLRSLLRTNIANLADGLVFYDEPSRNRFLEVSNNPNRLFVAPNAIDQSAIKTAREQWLTDPQGLNEFRRLQNLNRGPVLLFVSRLHASNRVDLLLRALKLLSEKFPGIQLVIIGNGEPERIRLHASAKALAIGSRVRFVEAIYDQHMLAPWFLSADVFAYPCNIGLSILHAFGFGVPVVTSNNRDSQNPEIHALVHGKNGLLYEHGSVNDLTLKLEAAIQNRDQLKAGALTTARHWGIDGMVAGFSNAIRYANGIEN